MRTPHPATTAGLTALTAVFGASTVAFPAPTADGHVHAAPAGRGSTSTPSASTEAPVAHDDLSHVTASAQSRDSHRNMNAGENPFAASPVSKLPVAKSSNPFAPGNTSAPTPSTPAPAGTSNPPGFGSPSTPASVPGPSISTPRATGPSSDGTGRMKPAILPNGIDTDDYRQPMQVTGAKDASEWEVVSGSLPGALTIDPATGIISGIVTATPGTFVFELSAVADGKTYSRWFSIKVIEPGSNNSTGPGAQGSSSDPKNDGQGNGSGDGSNPSSTSPSGSKPAGQGSGTPSSPGTSGPSDPTSPASPAGTSPNTPSSPADPTDPGTSDPSNPGTTDPSGTGSGPSSSDPSSPDPSTGDPSEINPGQGGSTPDSLAFPVPATIDVTVGEPLDDALPATSSDGLPVTYSAADLPSWASFEDGELTGDAPETEGKTTVELTATDGRQTVTHEATLEVVPTKIALTQASLDLIAGQVGQMQLDAEDGATNASFGYTLGQAVSTVSLADQMLTAEYDQPGSYSIAVVVTDAASPDDVQQTIVIPVTVSATPVVLSSESDSATQYSPFAAQLSASGGWGGYAYAVSSGSLPSGVKLSSTGLLSGAPTSTGTSTATIQVTDSHGNTAYANLTITAAPNPAVSPTNTIGVGATPYTTAFSPDGSTAYVADFGSKSVSVINVATGTVVATIPTAGQPESVSVSPDGSKLLIVNYTGGVQILSTATLSTATKITASGVYAGAWSADSSTVYLLGYSSSGSVLYTANAATGTIGPSIKLASLGPSESLELLADGRLVASGSSSSNVYVVSPATGAIQTIATGSANGAGSVAADGDVLWIATSGGSNNLIEFDLTVNKVVGKWSTGVTTQAGSALSTDGRWLYLVDSSSNAVVVFDTSSGSVVATVPVGKSPRGISVGADGRVYVTNSAGGTVTVLSPAQ